MTEYKMSVLKKLYSSHSITTHPVILMKVFLCRQMFEIMDFRVFLHFQYSKKSNLEKEPPALADFLSMGV